MAKPTAVILFGGRSSEHGVSCVTAGGVLAAIDRERWNVVAVGITAQGRWVHVSDDPEDWQIVDGAMPTVGESGDTVVLPRDAGEKMWRVISADNRVSDLADVDVVFPLLHGPWGEDGTVQGALELVDVRYVGSGVLASAAGMDKQFMKAAFRDAGLPVTPDVTLLRGDALDDHMDDVRTLGLPLFVKPARAGSSMGISKVTDLDELPAAIAEAVKHDPKVLIEQEVVGREIETAVLETAEGAVASPASEIITADTHDFYDFEAKYLDPDAVVLRMADDLESYTAARIEQIALKAFRAVGAEGLARVDVFLSEDGNITVNEINTMPGFTPTSQYPRMWAAAGTDFATLVETMLSTALARPLGLR
ncbi:D-alanine--D-alanine ligase family protein [Demequina globuliformis]|uniref:D-alanine--D-alanine ligase family protein n=1 Tax=Demequina globuliformis TaxID=676202 RepID=UPI000781039A|nr:D-alanine--D-alanine ligase family protein [Demequina globuliformis]